MQINNQQIALRSQSLFLFVLCITILSAIGLQKLLSLFPHPESPYIQLLIEVYRSNVYSKPIERNCFLILGLATPIVTLFLARNEGLFYKTNFSKLVTIILPFIITALLFAPLIHSNFFDVILPRLPFFRGGHRLALTCIILFIISSAWCLGRIHWQSGERLPSKSIRTLVWIGFISAMLLLMAAWRIVGINGVTESFAWSVHFDAAIYSTTQVVAGKTLLVDLPSQYGLFPELIAPLLRLTKATVLNLSLFFAALQIISLVGLFFVLSKLIKSNTVLFLGGISLLVMTYETLLYFMDVIETYYQYWPIRFFWPALSVLAFYFFTTNKNFWRCFLVSVTGALGLFWVIDTGLFISLSFAAYLAVRFIIAFGQRESLVKNDEKSLPDYKFYFVALCLHILFTLLLLTILFGALWIKAGEPLQFAWMFKYQKIFYGTGFGMMPLPQEIHPWMSVLGIYLLGLIISLISFYQNIKSTRADVVFFLSMLGLGLFVYYQGRAHDLNLLSVCWPALLLMIISADRILKRIGNKTLGLREIGLPIVTMTLLLICCLHFAINVPKMFKDARYKFATRNTSSWPVSTNELAFIKHYSQSKHECLILAKRQAIYYAETGLASPIKGPGLVEILLQSDLERIRSALLSGHINCVFLGIGVENNTSFDFGLEKLKEIYQVVSENPEHTLLYLANLQQKNQVV